MFQYDQPDSTGHFGPYGGSFASETLTFALRELQEAYARYQHDPEFIAEFNYELAHFVGRPSPVYHAARTSREMGGAQIFLKREDLNHTGAHKINNVIGQAMLARRMGKKRIIAETGAGQHGVASATVCARFGYPCVVYMGATDVERQKPNVFRMKLLGAEVKPVSAGHGTLKDAMNEALRDWVTNVEDTYYLIGTAAGPHPYPEMVRDFQSVIGREAREQIENRIGIGFGDAVLHGALHEARTLRVHLGLDLLAHGTAQKIGPAQRVAGELLGDLHHLLLVDDDPVGLGQDGFQQRVQVARVLQLVLDVDVARDVVHRPRPIERDHRDDVLEAVRPQPAQRVAHADRFQLEHALRLGPRQKLVGGTVVERQIGQDQGRAALVDQLLGLDQLVHGLAQRGGALARARWLLCDLAAPLCGGNEARIASRRRESIAAGKKIDRVVD